MGPEKKIYKGRNPPEDTTSPYWLLDGERLGWHTRNTGNGTGVDNTSPVFQCYTCPLPPGPEGSSSRQDSLTPHDRPPILLRNTSKGPLYRTNRCKPCTLNPGKGKHRCEVNRAALYLTQEEQWCAADEYSDKSVKYEYQGKELTIGSEDKAICEITLGGGQKRRKDTNSHTEDQSRKSGKRSRVDGTEQDSKSVVEEDQGEDIYDRKEHNEKNKEDHATNNGLEDKTVLEARDITNAPESLKKSTLPSTPRTTTTMIQRDGHDQISLITDNLNSSVPKVTASAAIGVENSVTSLAPPSLPSKAETPLLQLPSASESSSSTTRKASPAAVSDSFTQFKSRLSNALQPGATLNALKDLTPPPENCPNIISAIYEFYSNLTQEESKRQLAVKEIIGEYEHLNGGTVNITKEALKEMMQTELDLREQLKTANQEKELYQNRYNLAKQLTATHESIETKLRAQVDELQSFKNSTEIGDNGRAGNSKELGAEIERLKKELLAKDETLREYKTFVEDEEREKKERREKEQQRERRLGLLQSHGQK